MRGWFGNTFGGKLALYSLGVVALLAIGASSYFAVGLLGNDSGRVDRAISPTVAQTQAPDKTGPTQAEKDAAKKQAEEKAAKKKADKKKAEEEAAKKKAEEQAAAEQYDSWRAAAEEREQPVPDEAAGTEQAASEQPAAPTNSALSLTVPNAGIYNAPVTDSIAESVLAQGAGKMPETGFPWQQGSNTYIAGHVYGYEGTGSWQLFAALPNVGAGSEIYLTDANGTTYTYQVTETLVVAPTDVWVASPVPGQTTVSLQTCTGPGWSQRMIVRGVLV